MQPIWASCLRDVSLSAASKRNLDHPVTNPTEQSLLLRVCVLLCAAASQHARHMSLLKATGQLVLCNITQCSEVTSMK